MEPCSTPSPQAVRDQLEKILAAAPFAASTRSQRFLRHVVESSLSSGEESLKEYSIAVDVFDRDASYDPSIDATVRVEAGRLRARLREYYDEAGHNDPVLIAMPKGAYRATFESRPTPSEPAPAPSSVNPAATAAAALAASPATPAAPGSASRRSRLIRLWVIAASILLFLGLGSYGVYWSRHERLSPSRQQLIVLAVLPFANQTGVLTNDYLSEGLTDNLIRQLAELPRIRVVSREAVSGIDPRKAARDLGAVVLLTGELLRDPAGQLVLNAELSNAQDGRVMRSSQYFPDAKDLRSVQADIVQDVIQTLGLQLNEREREGVLRPLTTSPAAFQDFLRGESEMLNGDEDSIVSALHILQNAVQKDPEFAEAWTAMAAGEVQIGIFFELPGSHMEAARQYAERAIALDPAISEAHGVLGLVYLVYDWNFAAAQAQLASTNSREDAIWHIGCTAHLLNTSGGSPRHAEEDLEHMLEFNPGAVLIVSEMGCANYYAGRYDESVRYYRDALASAPGSVLANWGLGRSLGREGKYSEAIADLRRFNSIYGIEHPLTLGEIGYLQGLSGDRDGALATIHKLETKGQTEFVDPIFIAQSYLGLGDHAQTYAWLDRAYKIRSPFMTGLATDPRWASLRGERRFNALWNRMTGEAHITPNTARQQDPSSRVSPPGHG